MIQWNTHTHSIVTANSLNRNSVENTMITDTSTENNNSNNMELRSLTENNNRMNNDNKNIKNTTNTNTSNREVGVFGSNNISNNMNNSTTTTNTTINSDSRTSTFAATAVKCQQKYYEMLALVHKLIKREKTWVNLAIPAEVEVETEKRTVKYKCVSVQSRGAEQPSHLQVGDGTEINLRGC
uniref:Uncharacterized protein n=1 Tax=Octopus bimaculoides TaxID=37653 RepID=A0A0L8FYE0_OCTBM